MYIEFKEDWIDTLKTIDSFSDGLKEIISKSYKYSARSTSIAFADFTREDLDIIYAKAKEIGDRSVMMQVAAYTKVLDAPNTAKVSNIKVFAALLRTYLADGAINHWIFESINGFSLPYLVTKIVYNEATKDNPASVTMQLKANTVRYLGKSCITFDSGDVSGKTMLEILANASLEKETSELINSYNLEEEKFLEERASYNKQYRVYGSGHRLSSWSLDTTDFNGVRMINDEQVHDRRYTFKTTCDFWKEDDDTQQKVYKVPTHPFLYLYSLETYEHVYAHVSFVKDYIYDDSLREKLILPETHSDLLDILTQDLSLLSGDIIEGKSSGTTILCKGKPGTGKTLTAEAYSEITHRPLYKVNSGQLGTFPADVEKNLEEILSRAERWGAVMLIDEADTYIRERGNDIAQNAIVAAFLRTLEYFNGLLFMTTNRMDDVDDAIASRCIATIEYDVPDAPRAEKIWRVLADQFSLDISDDTIKILVKTFPEASGRDIKELLRLTGRFAKAKNLPLDKKTFISCAQFRGLHIVE